MGLHGLRKRGGLSEAGAARLRELSLQMVDLRPKALPLTRPSVPFVSQGVTLAFRSLGSLTPPAFARRLGGRGGLRRSRHAPVMPESACRYKTPLINYQIWSRQPHRLTKTTSAYLG